MEDPTVAAPAEPKAGVVPGLDLSGYRTTPASVTPIAPGAQINREGVMIEWTDRNIANATFEGTARELLRMQLASPIHPLGEMTFNPIARPRRSGMARHVCRRRRLRQRRAEGHPPDEPAAARQLERQDPAHRPRPARAHRHQHGQRQRALPHPQRQPVRVASTGRARRSGRPACAIRIGWCGTSTRRGPTRAAAVRVQYRAHRVGDGGRSSRRARTTATRCARARRR